MDYASHTYQWQQDINHKLSEIISLLKASQLSSSTPAGTANGVLNTEPPPLGLRPKWLSDEQRIDEINKAILRYSDAGKTIPEEWVSERRNLYANLPSKVKKQYNDSPSQPPNNKERIEVKWIWNCGNGFPEFAEYIKKVGTPRGFRTLLIELTKPTETDQERAIKQAIEQVLNDEK